MANHIDYEDFNAWTNGVPVEEEAFEQIRRIARLPFVRKPALMPDVHVGIGSTVGSVIPTYKAIIPAAVGVDIGCGMAAVKLDGINSSQLPDNLYDLRCQIEKVVPVGFDQHMLYQVVDDDLFSRFCDLLRDDVLKLSNKEQAQLTQKMFKQMGTLGGGNHFVELCVDTEQNVWLMLHSGSRGIGNILGSRFIEIAKEDMRTYHINIPDKNLSYLSEGTKNFDSYVRAMLWAQDYALENRKQMLHNVLNILHANLPSFSISKTVVNCHHNYVEMENHMGKNLWITRKGAVRARLGDLGIIPGSMGARSFIVRGLGNPLSYHSCSHGAGRVMSRKRAKQEISLEEHIQSTNGVECRKDAGVIDESPKAYKDIDAVMAAQSDLVEIVAELKQVLCIKG